MKIILDPACIFISDEEWKDREKRACFLKNFFDLLEIINLYDFFKIVWSSNLTSTLWNEVYTEVKMDSGQDYVAFAHNIQPFLNNLESITPSNTSCIKNMILHNSISYKTETLDEVLKILHKLIEEKDIAIYALEKESGISTENIYFKCGCHDYKLIPETIVAVNEMLNNEVVEELIQSNVNFDDLISANNILPDLKYSKQEAKKYKEMRFNGSAEKNAQIEIISKKIALRNGYKLAKDITRINQIHSRSLRSIYQGGIGRNKIFLSTDFEKGAFEVCDHNGKHLAEYSFNGGISKKKDASGNHDILLSNS